MATLIAGRSGNGSTSPTDPHEPVAARLGDLLRRAREARGLTLEQVSSETKIPLRHLEALEHGNLAVVPGEFYRRAEIRAYARVVNLDQHLVLATLDSAATPPAAAAPVAEVTKIEQPVDSRRRGLLAIGVVVVVVGFGLAVWGRATGLNAGSKRTSAASSRPNDERAEQPADAMVGTSQRTPQGAARDSVALTTATDLSRAVATAPPAAETPVSNGALAQTLEPAVSRPAAVAVTELVVRTQPTGAHVTVNGIGWGPAPVRIRHLDAGDKRIRVSKDGYVAAERLVGVDEGQRRVLDIRLRTTP